MAKPIKNAVPMMTADRDEWVELMGLTPSDELLSFVGVPRTTHAAILAGDHVQLPAACFRLARYRRYGALDDLLGPDWREFEVRGQALALPGVKYPVTAPELRTIWLRLMELGRLQSHVAMLQADLQKAEAAQASAEDRADYWHRQCRLEARAGLMLARIADLT